jgi:hypothetical protein
LYAQTIPVRFLRPSYESLQLWELLAALTVAAEAGISATGPALDSVTRFSRAEMLRVCVDCMFGIELNANDSAILGARDATFATELSR